MTAACPKPAGLNRGTTADINYLAVAVILDATIVRCLLVHTRLVARLMPRHVGERPLVQGLVSRGAPAGRW